MSNLRKIGRSNEIKCYYQTKNKNTKQLDIICEIVGSKVS